MPSVEVYSQPITRQPVQLSAAPPAWEYWTLGLAAVLLLGLPGLWYAAPWMAAVLAHLAYKTPVLDPLWNVARLRFYLVFYDVFAAAACTLSGSVAVRSRLFERKTGTTVRFVLLCLALCAGMAAFVVIIGRTQFGGYDFDILVDLGWRTFLGQKPYVDFVTYMPPGFIFGLKYAFRLFGASWDANLYLTALLAVVSFAWMVVLLRRLDVSRGVALLLAFSVEAAAVLSLCFWWYNNTTMIAAAVFYLSCLNLAKRAEPLLFDEVSYSISLGLLLLTKPNIAGLTVALCVPLLFVFSQRRWRLLGFTAIGLWIALTLLWTQGLSAGQLLLNDRAIAADRGGLNPFGYNLLNKNERGMTLLWLGVLSLPLLSVLAKLPEHARDTRRRDLLWDVLLLSAPLTAIYGVMTNGEWRDVDCTLLLLASGLALLHSDKGSDRWRHYFAALLLANAAADLTYGAQRQRIYTVGPHKFFEWESPLQTEQSGFLKHARVSHTLIDVQQQVGEALAGQPGSVFFGPRMLTNYAVTLRPSPEHIPLFWEPGTAFPKSESDHWAEVWRKQRFTTLILLRDDTTYYTPALLASLQQDFRRDDRYPALTVYHHR